MPFKDTPTRAIVELDTEGRPVGRFQIEAHRTLDEDPAYVRVVASDIDAAAFGAIWDNAAVHLSGELQAAQQTIATLQGQVAARDAKIAAKDALINQYAALETAWNTQIQPAIEAHRQAAAEQ